jgi:hypothetical protein
MLTLSSSTVWLVVVVQGLNQDMEGPLVTDDTKTLLGDDEF